MLKRSFIFKKIVITLDGPAASGKSTTARLVARQLGWLYLDTGAMYRAIAVKAIRKGLSLDDSGSIGVMVKETHIRLAQNETGMRIFIDNEEVTDHIRTPEIDKAVGPVCEVPAVRQEMVRLQREIAKYGHMITDGRDMGTVVFPEADLKFFLTASIEERARRRQIDMKKQGLRVSLVDIQSEILERDKRDSLRDHSPLRQADDAILIDTSEMTVESQVDFVLKQVDALLHHLPLSRIAQKRFYKITAFLLYPLFKTLFGFRIKGQEYFPMVGSVLVAPNHVSMMDPVIVGLACPREIFYFAKQELFKVPGFSLIIRSLNAFPVKREQGDRNAIRNAFHVLNSKKPLLLFPEGTRSKTGRLQSAKTGLGMMALYNQANILPVAVQGTYRLFQYFWKRRICVTFGKPIAITPFLESMQPKKEIYRQIGELTIKRIRELQDDCQH